MLPRDLLLGFLHQAYTNCTRPSTTTAMNDSDSSELSDVPEAEVKKLAPIFLKSQGKPKTKKAKSPLITVTSPKPKRPSSPPREETLADNADIAVSRESFGHAMARSSRVLLVYDTSTDHLMRQLLVMFRSRFSAAFPAKMSHFGPQDIERGVVGDEPSPQVENLLCALLGILLNRKKPVE